MAHFKTLLPQQMGALQRTETLEAECNQAGSDLSLSSLPTETMTWEIDTESSLTRYCQDYCATVVQSVFCWVLGNLEDTPVAPSHGGRTTSYGTLAGC